MDHINEKHFSFPPKNPPYTAFYRLRILRFILLYFLFVFCFGLEATFARGVLMVVSQGWHSADQAFPIEYTSVKPFGAVWNVVDVEGKSRRINSGLIIADIWLPTMADYRNIESSSEIQEIQNKLAEIESFKTQYPKSASKLAPAISLLSSFLSMANKQVRVNGVWQNREARNAQIKEQKDQEIRAQNELAEKTRLEEKAQKEYEAKIAEQKAQEAKIAEQKAQEAKIAEQKAQEGKLREEVEARLSEVKNEVADVNTQMSEPYRNFPTDRKNSSAKYVANEDALADRVEARKAIKNFNYEGVHFGTDIEIFKRDFFKKWFPNSKICEPTLNYPEVGLQIYLFELWSKRDGDHVRRLSFKHGLLREVTYIFKPESIRKMGGYAIILNEVLTQFGVPDDKYTSDYNIRYYWRFRDVNRYIEFDFDSEKHLKLIFLDTTFFDENSYKRDESLLPE